MESLSSRVNELMDPYVPINNRRCPRMADFAELVFFDVALQFN